MQHLRMALLTFLALIGLLAAWYAHAHLFRHIASRSGVLVTHSLLLIVGLAFGYVVSTATYADGALRWFAFLAGFGAVHIPAAIVLWLKQARRSA